MTTSIRPLPRSLDPLPDESLPGYVLRLAHRLDCSPARIAVLTGLRSAGLNAGRLTVPSRRMLHLDPATAAAFGHATSLTSREVAGLCLSSFGGRYQPLDLHHELARVRQAGGIAGLARWVFTRSTRYCPDCLAGDGSPIQQAHGGAWQTLWRLPPVFACLIHQRLLLHQCPECHTPVHSHHGHAALVPRIWDASLHPAQCRTSLGTDRHGRWALVCGARLDATANDAGQALHQQPAPDRLLALQQRLTQLLQPNRQTSAAAHYFLDARLLMGLICASWPEARHLAEPWIPVPAINVHIQRQQRHTTARRQAGRKTLDVVLHDRPPLDASACAGLFALADHILALQDPEAIGQRLQPLIACVLDRPTWARHLRAAAMTCSEGLRQAIEPQLPRSRPAGRRPTIISKPVGAHRFGPQHIPQFLPTAWHDHHFRGLTGIHPRFLRRFVPIRLVQMAQGGSRQAAAEQLGLSLGMAISAGFLVQRWAKGHALQDRLHAGLEALALELDTASVLVDYSRRRDALKTWSIPETDWQELADEVGRDQTPAGRAHTDWGARKRLVASVLVWTRVTQGEHLIAPLVVADNHAPGRPHNLARHVQHLWAIRGTTRPHNDRHWVRLADVLDTYAGELAVRIDARWRPA